MVEDQSLEVLSAVLAEEESVDLRTKLLEGKVGRGEQGTAGMVGAVVGVKKASLAESQLESRELRGKEVNDLEGSRGRNEKAVDTVDDTVGTEDVDGNHSGVEIDSQTLETKVDTESLRSLAGQMLALEESRNGMGDEDSASRVEVIADVVLEELLDHLLARLVVRIVVRESRVGRCEDGEVARVSRVELLDEVRVPGDELRELLSVL